MLGQVVNMKWLSSDIICMVIQSEQLALSLPGQFVNMKCGHSLNAYLRRPISICRVDKHHMTADIVFQIRGEGTAQLAKTKQGEMADYMGPLGTPFRFADKGKKVVVIGGGIGVFPLLGLLESMPDVHRTALLGFRNKESIVMESEFAQASDQLKIATDDGSYGTHGFVTSILHEHLKQDRPDIVYVCGPTLMMKAVTEMCLKDDIDVQVSMEQRMGCGVGACLVCACKKKTDDDYTYTHVCKEGPVFDGKDILFDDI